MSVYHDYEHWEGRPKVWVRTDLQGKHREHCLCWSCTKLKPGKPDNCPRAQELYEYCVRNDMTTPVWECPDFEAVLDV